MIVLMAGLPGTGKSTLARALAGRTSGRVLSKDEIRHAIFLPEEIEYSSRQDDYCLRLMLETAGYLLSQTPERLIFLDGVHFRGVIKLKMCWRLPLPCSSRGAFSNSSARK